MPGPNLFDIIHPPYYVFQLKQTDINQTKPHDMGSKILAESPLYP